MCKNRFALLLLFAASIFSIQAQEEYVAVDEFNKVELGQHIRAIFLPGETEGIRYELNGIHPDELIIRAKGKNLEIFLDKARNFEKQRKVYDNGYKEKMGWYQGNWVTVYISYMDLKKVVVKGDEDLDI